MSQSTDAIFAFGWDLGGQHDETVPAWAHRLAERFLVPEDDYAEQSERIERLHVAHSPTGLADDCPFQIVTYCSLAAPKYLLAVRSSVVIARRGHVAYPLLPPGGVGTIPPSVLESMDLAAPIREMLNLQLVTIGDDNVKSYTHHAWMMVSFWEYDG